MKIIHSVKAIDFRLLADVYIQSSREQGRLNYPGYPVQQQILLAEQELYGDLKCFFDTVNSFYAVWEIEGRYVSALRMEPYQDGMILEGLETAPQDRGNGYAKKLVSAVLSELSKHGNGIIYSHVDNKNAASMAVHLACGFEKVKDCAV